MYVIYSFTAFLGLAFLLRPRPSDILLRQRCDTVVAKVAPGRFDDFLDHIKEDFPKEADDDFWLRSLGLKGVWDRVRDLTYVMYALQTCVLLGLVSKDEAREVRASAIAQLIYSVAAVPEALLCNSGLLRGHINALAAARAHWHVTLMTLTLCQVDGAPEGLLSRRALL